MPSTARSESLPWLIGGAAFLAVLLVFGWYARQAGDRTSQLASHAARVDLVARMQRDLASAAEAEKSAVLATTDAESLAFADKARASTADVEREQQELGNLLTVGGAPHESDLLAQFSLAFADLRRVDDEVLRLAVKNSNIKAYGLLFGAAARTVTAMDDALDRVVTRYADSADGKQVTDFAFRARLGVLRLQVTLAPHIAEESDAKMDAMEAAMAKEEAGIRRDLEGLGALARLRGDADLAAAASRFDAYEEIKGRIVPLSRANTNVRSLTLSLNQKRKAMTLCLDALGALRQAMLDEPVASPAHGRAEKPR